MNKNKYIASTNLQAKTLKLKKYSDKIKLLYSLAKNNASLRNQILDKARDNSVISVWPDKFNSINTNTPSPSSSLGKISPIFTLGHGQGQGKGPFPCVQQGPLSPYLSSEAGPVGHNRGGKKAFIKTPLVRISRRLHRHIKSVFKFNSEVAKNNTIVYNFNNNLKKFKLTSILENSFFSMNRLISKPILNIKPNKIIIHLFFYLSHSSAMQAQTAHVLHNGSYSVRSVRSAVALEGRKFVTKQARIKLVSLLRSKSAQLQALCAFLSKKFKKPVEFELIRLHHPSLESNILANTIGYIAKNTRKTFRVIMLKLFKSTKIKKFNEFKYIYNIRKFKPTALVGIRIKLGGRLLSQRIVPRFTSRTIQRGNLGKTKADFITTSRFTNKNKRGAFSFTVTMGHKFF